MRRANHFRPLASIALAFSLAAWPVFAESPMKPRLRQVAAIGDRDVITLKHGAQFKGVILREKDKSVRFLAALPSGRIHEMTIPLSRIKRIARLTPEDRKAARASLEDAQPKARKAVAQSAVLERLCFFWRAPHGGVFGYACDSLLRAGGYTRPGSLPLPHYLTTSGMHLMQGRGYRLIELRYRTFIPVYAAHQSIVDQAYPARQQ